MGFYCSPILLNYFYNKNTIYYYYNMQYPVLIPYARTGPSLVISSPHSKLGSQTRIYTYHKQQGQAKQYEQQLINALGLKNLPK